MSGRSAAQGSTDSLMINRELVRRGMAVVAVYPPNVRHVALLRAAADSARAERAGLWSGSAFRVRARGLSRRPLPLKRTDQHGSARVAAARTSTRSAHAMPLRSTST